MPTFQRCDKSVDEMAGSILAAFDTHLPLIEQKVKIDFVFAYAKVDDHGLPVGPALKVHGVMALGICRILPLKDRALGRGDAEISLDGDWWKAATEPQQRALLDHELHHLYIKRDKNLAALRDDLGRPLLQMRKHDFQFGWFSIIAERNGAASMERVQAKLMMDLNGQTYWPEFIGGVIQSPKAGPRKRGTPNSLKEAA